MISNNTPPNEEAKQWRLRLNQFVKENEQRLAALTWGLHLEQKDQDNHEVLGIDMQPTPHFVSCPREALEKLNQDVNHQIREVLGIIDGYKPEEEIMLLGIGNGQINIINYKSNPSPPECYEQVTEDIDTLLQSLEAQLSQIP